MKYKIKLICSVLCFCGAAAGGLLSLICFSLLLSGCSGENVPAGVRSGHSLEIRIASWNVQTFFDAQTQGSEYAEFRGTKSVWNTEKYIKRLERLCESILVLDADILVLQEIENESVLRDVLNFLAGKNTYRYICFAAGEGAAIGCGVLSRMPIAETSVHQIDSRVHGVQPQLRPILELTVSDVSAVPVCTLLVCHWKSKSGGSGTAAVWQSEQELLTAIRLHPPSVCTKLSAAAACLCLPAVICGDFNRDIGDFRQTGISEKSVFLGNVPVVSGWLAFDPQHAGSGSYFYQNKWEKIDHIFTAGNIELIDFSAVDGPWACPSENGEKIPFRYSVWNGQGYSDHMPVAATVRLPYGRQPK